MQSDESRYEQFVPNVIIFVLFADIFDRMLQQLGISHRFVNNTVQDVCDDLALQEVS